MNIIEAYIKFKEQLIIFISGLPACGKLKLAKKIRRDFKLKLINEFDYYNKDYNVTTKLHDGTELINWYTDDAINWDKLNADIDDSKKDGVIVVGFALPEDKIKVDVDYHLHVNIAKQLCMEKRKEFVEKHKDKYKEEFSIIGTQTEKLKMNQLIYPYYLESTKKSKINKFINITNMTDDEVYDKAFEYLIDFIEDFLYPEDSTSITPKVTQESKKTFKSGPKTETSSLSFSGELLTKPRYSYDKNLDMISELSDPDEFKKGDGPIKFIPENEWLQAEEEIVEAIEEELDTYEE
ncbi:uridine kinase [Indivirus ILV1]|uniref:Uridine kinase n=1 Tax=Indivirus ILV1 TaxID=1977633 RepID=A0A1V0SCW0_9VIRU|nr:uridine kinase [Indivirus ILV1]